MSNSQDLLFEIGCEELPPKSLNKMAESLLRSVTDQLLKLDISYKETKYFSSPRRLAFIIESLAGQQPDKSSQRLGPPVESSFDGCNVPTNAAIGFAKSCGTNFENLEQIDTPKGKRLAFVVEEKGNLTASLLPQIIEIALKKLPISKMMRWGDHSYSFVRPVHWIVFLYGHKVIDMELFGKKASNLSYGHRYISPGAIKIDKVSAYPDQLLEAGHVVVDIAKRKQMIQQGLIEVLEDKALNVLIDDELLDEVASIVEYPYPLVCSFNHDFLRVPQESLITAMQSHQKCFPVVDKTGKLVNKFITVCNINSEKPEIVIQGNERVMAARLSDAAFFYDSDVKIPLEKFSARLENVIFQKQLGSTQDKVERITQLALYIADQIQADKQNVERAGVLSKADLMTDMVFEFPELQGLMGYYYAQAQGEHNDVALALNEQYLPKFSGDVLPSSKTGICLSLADKLDTLVGIFGIGQKPTGDKDPFALRRAVIGVLRILKETGSDVDFVSLLRFAKSLHQAKLLPDTVEQVEQFAFERLKGLYKDEGVDFDVFDAVASVEPQSILDFDQRIQAVLSFKDKPESADLSQANKRISNILSKNNINGSSKVNESALVESTEKDLYKNLVSVSQEFKVDIQGKSYLPALDKLCALNTDINQFFDNVMVMDENEEVRNNRIALLSTIQNQFRQVADISKLVIETK